MYTDDNYKFSAYSALLNMAGAYAKENTNDETLNLGGILTYICIWSGHASAAIISTSFHLEFLSYQIVF